MTDSNCKLLLFRFACKWRYVNVGVVYVCIAVVCLSLPVADSATPPTNNAGRLLTFVSGGLLYLSLCSTRPTQPGHPFLATSDAVSVCIAVVRVSLLTQNLSVTACCISVCARLIYAAELWWRPLLDTCVITLAVIGQLASMAYKIAIERDWIVVVAAGDKSLLASMSVCL